MGKGRIFIFSNPIMESLASRFGDVHKIDRQLFPGGMPNILIHDMEQVQQAEHGSHIVYFSQYGSLGEKKIEEMIIFVFADTHNVRSLTIVDLYDPMATMERVTVEGTIASSNVDAHFWNTLPRLDSGRKITRILYDHHTLQNRFYFTGGSTSVVFKSAIPVYLTNRDISTQMVVFPDEGAYKRFGPYFKDWDTIVCGKKRVGDQRIVVIKEGDPTGKDVVIVDDLVRSGGTLVECAKVLKTAGANNVDVFVTHAEFTNNSWKRFKYDQQDVVRKFYTTNSIPRSTNVVKNMDEFIVLDLYSDLKNIFIQRGLSK